MKDSYETDMRKQQVNNQHEHEDVYSSLGETFAEAAAKMSDPSLVTAFLSQPQASHDNLPLALYSWALNLLPLFNSNAHSRPLILQFVERILELPDAETKLLNAALWDQDQLIPPPSFEILLRLTFPATSTGEEVTVTARFKKIYPVLKKVVVAGAQERKADVPQIFTCCLRLAGEGNPVLAKEAKEIAIWSLTKNADCWEYVENLETSFTLVKMLVKKWGYYSYKLSFEGAPESEAIIRQIFTFCLRLAGKGNPVLAKEATEIAIWSLNKKEDCWEHWDNICKENVEATVALLQTFVKKTCEDQSLKLSVRQIFTFSMTLAGKGIHVLAKEATAIAFWALTKDSILWGVWVRLYKKNPEDSVTLLEKLVEKCEKDHSSPVDTLISAPDSCAIQQIFSIALALAERSHSVLPNKDTEIAIRSLHEILDCCKGWDLYEENAKHSVVLLKRLLENWKEHLHELSLTSRSGKNISSNLGSAAESKAMKQLTEQIFIFALKLAKDGILVRNERLNYYGEAYGAASEATEIAIETVDCSTYWENLCKENLEASVCLLNKSTLELLSSPSDTLGVAPENETIQRIFTSSLRLAGKGNPVLAREATSIALRLLTENIECCTLWDNLYEENIKASVVLLKKLVNEWKDHSFKQSDALTLTQTMKSFRLKNKTGITEGGFSDFLYEEADKSCKVILETLSRLWL